MKNKYIESSSNLIKWKTSSNLIKYNVAIENMGKYINDIKNNKSPEIIWLLEHPSIYTCGRSAKSDDLLDTHNTPVINSGRGGQVTYHGPGQRIIYIMLNLQNREKDVKKYIHTLENWMIMSLKQINIKAHTAADRIGLWVEGPKGESKIGAIGVRISKWITSHGISINIDPDLSFYNGIIPCGLNNYPVTSFRELGCNTKITEFDEIIKKTIKDFF